MSIPEFKLEEYLSRYEFSAPYLLCCSDAESFNLQEILAMADVEDKTLWDTLTLNYTTVPGFNPLRQTISQALYPSLDMDNILCFAGAGEGIFCALHALCEPGDHIIVLTPCYQSLKEIPALKGASVTTLLLQETNAWRMDIDDIKQALKPSTKAIVINFPHNPTGQVLRPWELKELVTLCDLHGVWLFSDEVYHLMGSPKNGWVKPAAEVYPKALSLGVMSKSFGMAGLRIGWIACQDKELLKKLEQMKHYTSICNSGPAEVISLIALKNKERVLERNNQIVAHNLTLLDSFMEDHCHFFSWVRPEGGCVGFVDYKTEEPVEHFTDRLVHSQGVLLMPSSVYDYKSNYFRIGFGRKNMPQALEKLKEFLR